MSAFSSPSVAGVAKGASAGAAPYVDPQQAVRERRTMGPGFGPGSARELMEVVLPRSGHDR